MSEDVNHPDGMGIEVGRILGRIRGERPGPTLLVIAGLHGNEPAGVHAFERVLPTLEARADRVRGEVVGLAGNRRALGAYRRFLARDLNRAWTPERVEMLRNGRHVEVEEDEEQAELLDAIDEVFAAARGAVHVLDLHTTSGPGGGFSAAGDTLRNRAFALQLSVPFVVGLEEQIGGTLTDWIDSSAATAVVFESGQHADPWSVSRAEGAIWIALVTAGILAPAEAPEAETARGKLSSARDGVPRALEFRYRHPVEPGDGFEMLPGFRSFQPVRRGQLLARVRGREIHAPEDARVLMPLYQEQGEDGFFIVREFRFAWLRISELLRRAHIDRLIHWLPGVRRVPGRDDVLSVNRGVARWFALEILHLLGYRRQVEQDQVLLVERRPE